MSPKLLEILEQAQALAVDEQLQLIAHLAEKIRHSASSDPQSSTEELSKQSDSVNISSAEKSTGKSLLEMFDAFIADLPPEELAKLPTDGAEQHDHYIYGTPKIDIYGTPKTEL